jgi:ABC-type dipeptide/oligopeptide/nickel transport system permease subunit
MPDTEPGPAGTRTDAEAQPPDAAHSGAAVARPAVHGPEREFTVKARTQRQLILRRFLQHRLAVGSLIVFLLVVLVSLIGARLWHYKYLDITPEFSTPPSLKHPMGTDGLGHDGFAQVLRGAQKSVQVALLVAFLSTGSGTLVGALAGYYRGVTDSVLMRFTDLVLTIPAIAILIVIASALNRGGGSWWVVALVLAALLWTSIARVVRGVFLSLREKEYVEAARALGASDRRIIFRHLLPNATGAIIVNATITVAVAILLETALSYLGVGIQSPDVSLGSLVSSGQQAATTRPWLFYFPGLIIIIIALTINFIGDGLRDAFDPAQKRVRA